MRIDTGVIICVVTLACLIFNTVTDIRTKHTNTVSIYLGCLTVALLRLCGLYPERLPMLDFLFSALVMELLLTGIRCLLGGRIGAGDFDILLLLFLTTGWTGFFPVLVASGMAVLVVTLPMLWAKMITLQTRWPCVPFFLVGYLTYLILGGIG